MGLFGAALDSTILRRVLGQPQFAVVMLTIGLGAIFRSFASITWGSEIYTLPTPFSAKATRVGGVTVSHEYVSIIVGTVVLCAVLFVFFRRTRVGVAMQAASQNQLAAYYMGIPVKRMFSLIWAISAGVAAIAGVLLAPVSLIDINLGFIGLKAFAAAVLGGFGSIPGALVGGITIGLIELFSGTYLPHGFKDVAAYVVLLLGPGDPAAGHVRQRRPEEGLRPHALRLQDDVRAGPGTVPRCRPAQLVRGAAGWA